MLLIHSFSFSLSRSLTITHSHPDTPLLVRSSSDSALAPPLEVMASPPHEDLGAPDAVRAILILKFSCHILNFSWSFYFNIQRKALEFKRFILK